MSHQAPMPIDRRTFVVSALAAAACASRAAPHGGGESAPDARSTDDERGKSARSSRVFITGSSSGLGLLAGQQLAEQGHRVVLHARNAERAKDTRSALPGAEAVVVGDASSIAAIESVAAQVNALGPIDAVIHNVGIGDREPHRVVTADGLSQIFAVNVVAPYILTALIPRPRRLVYLSSGMHTGGDAGLEDLQWEKRSWDGTQAYSDSKLHDLLIALAVARRWPDIYSNAVDPGWVPTRMGGAHAPDDLDEGAATQVWLAASDDPKARVTGQYLHHREPSRMHPEARRTDLQDRLMATLKRITGIDLPSAG